MPATSSRVPRGRPSFEGERAATLLRGCPGREGFLFHDGYNQPILQAPPGLLGLLEGRHVIERWKPAIVQWMDEAGHFFNHIDHEFESEPHFAPLRREIEAIRETEVAPAAKNRFLFQYLEAVAAELERSQLTLGAQWHPVRVLPDDREVTLNGVWTAYYRYDHGRYAEREMTLPTNWELAPGIDNYAGSMRFTRTVDVPASLNGRRLSLSFLGVDYFADVWVNGHYAGGHEGCFGPFTLDVSALLRFGDVNIVRLAVTSPNEPAGGGTHVASGWGDFRPEAAFPNRKTLIKGTLGHHDAKRGGAWSSLTSQDGNTGGAWNDMAVLVRDPIHFALTGARVTTLALEQLAGPDDGCRASIEVRLPVQNTTDELVRGRVRVQVRPANFEGVDLSLEAPVTLHPGTNSVRLHHHELAPVRPWEPWDTGFPHLYTVSAVLEVDGKIRDEVILETGFRHLAVTPIGESPGPGGAWIVNGEPVSVRGTNLLPTYWLSEYTEEKIDADFRMLREAGFNAVMIHAVVGPRRLYRAANRHGILIVQMFPLQWSYEQGLDFVERATRQIRELTDFLANDPSVVSYETHNEPDMRTAEGLDNRLIDFQLHAGFRESDPSRWATTFSGGNHAYPGQFYPARDDNLFATLPARFEHDEYHGRRISRHRNMPTEFGIQAMPALDLFRELLSEEKVGDVLERIRTDPKWLAAAGESWEAAQKTLAAATDILGAGSWERALDALDWRLLWRMGDLAGELDRIERGELSPGGDIEAEIVSRRLALLLVDVLHYGAFKGENFWFGLWMPARSPAQFVKVSQDRQYRLHKDAIETFLNAGTEGPLVGWFSFMFRDADWQAPTWGVVDARGTPKKAYRAYVESNQPVRVSLPQALRRPVKLPGDPWFGANPEEEPTGVHWVDAEMIVSNDTRKRFSAARVTVWLEDSTGARVPLVDGRGEQTVAVALAIDLEPGQGFAASRPRSAEPPGAALGRWAVPEDAEGVYHLRAQVSSSTGEALSTNSYEFFVPDTAFAQLHQLSDDAINGLLHGHAGAEGFHYWHHGHVTLRAAPGVKGFLAGYSEACESGIDLHETTQGEHFFRHILAELEAMGPSTMLIEPIWRIRSEVLSPTEKTSALLRYLGHFAARAETHLPKRSSGRRHERKERK